MWKRKLLLSVMVAGTMGAIAPCAQALDIFVNTPPPALREEVMPAPRAGYVWAPGYWDWRSNKHVWTRGHWERERVGYYYHSPRWTERDGRWVIERSRWDRNRPMGDRDGDGVPNRVDRAPDNPRQH